MTDDVIQDILVQTESDPAFQALFDLFDYGRFEQIKFCYKSQTDFFIYKVSLITFHIVWREKFNGRRQWTGWWELQY